MWGTGPWCTKLWATDSQAPPQVQYDLGVTPANINAAGVQITSLLAATVNAASLNLTAQVLTVLRILHPPSNNGGLAFWQLAPKGRLKASWHIIDAMQQYDGTFEAAVIMRMQSPMYTLTLSTDDKNFLSVTEVQDLEILCRALGPVVTQFPMADGQSIQGIAMSSNSEVLEGSTGVSKFNLNIYIPSGGYGA